MAMEAVAAGRHQEIDSRSLGWWLRRNRDQIIGGLRLESVGRASGVARWRVVEDPGGQGGHGGHSRGTRVMRFPRLKIMRFPRLR